jgi:hypothetical protein
MSKIIRFEEAIQQSDPAKRHLLLGNGFSIACRPEVFEYTSLLEKADFGSTDRARKAFDVFATSDFERVVRLLRNFARLAPLYGVDDSQANTDADATREILIKTIQCWHPEYPELIQDVEFRQCWNFVSEFTNVFTLNYDLLLYWTQMKRLQTGGEMGFSDGFIRKSGALSWSPSHYGERRTFYLHGALHLFEENGTMMKCVSSADEPRILYQVAEAIRRDCYPVYVCEGRTEEKLGVIRRFEYLSYAFSELGRIEGDLFIFGHSLRDEDKHILDQIKDSGVKRLFVSVRPGEGINSTAELQGRAVALAAKMDGAEVHFFDADSAKVWK